MKYLKQVNDTELKFYAKPDINPTPPFDESRSSIKIANTGYTVDNTEDTTYDQQEWHYSTEDSDNARNFE